MPTAKLGDIDLHYEIHGSGRPVILVSGYTGDHAFWDPVRAALAQSLQVVVFDNRAIGLTRDDGRPFSIETMAGDTARLTEHLGLHRPIVVGQSMGGAIAQTLLARFAHACGPCIIFNSTERFSKRATMALQCTLALRQADVASDLVAESILPWVASEACLANPAYVEAFKAGARMQPPIQSAADQARQLAAIEAFDARAFNAKTALPALVVASSDDVLTTVREGHALAASLGASFREIPGGHASPLEQPDVLAGIIEEFALLQ
jgi:3-oxoadipate enol-lactonase